MLDCHVKKANEEGGDRVGLGRKGGEGQSLRRYLLQRGGGTACACLSGVCGDGRSGGRSRCRGAVGGFRTGDGTG